MLEAVKTALGIKANAFDAEFEMLIASAIADLAQVGIMVFEDTDPLIITAVSCYCQANRGTDTDRRLNYQKMYTTKKRNLMLDSRYTGDLL